MIARVKRSIPGEVLLCPKRAPTSRMGSVHAGHRLGADELACKPDPVPGRLAAAPFGGHPSRPAVTGGLVRPTRRLGRAALERLRRHPRIAAVAPSWPCSGWGL